MKVCNIEGCERKHHGKGLCDAHGKLKMRRENPEYSVWQDIKRRCYNRNYKQYDDYGGRGIEVCVRWRNSYKNFLEDMGSRPVGTTIERLDNNGNYEPSNCKWATYLEQNRNRRNTRLVTYKGVSLKLSEWAKLVDIPHTTLKDRYYRGWQVDQLLTKPKGR